MSLYGLTLVARRPVSFGRIDPAAAREVFIREALVPGALRTRGAFLAHNRALVADVQELEHKARRQDVLVDEETIGDFYAERVPPEVHSLATFERWREDAERRDPRLLFVTREYLMRHGAAAVTAELFPRPSRSAMSRCRSSTASRRDIRSTGSRSPCRCACSTSSGCAPHVARARHGAREGHASLEGAAQGIAQSRDPAAGDRHRLPGGRACRGTSLSPTCCAPSSKSASPRPSRRRSCAMSRCRRTSRSTSRSWTTPARSWPRDATCRRCARSSARPRPVLCQRGPRVRAPRSRALGLRRSSRIDRGHAARRKVTGYPALVDDGDSVSLALLDTAEAAEASTRAGVVRLLGIALRDATSRYEKGGAALQRCRAEAQGDDSHRPSPGRRARPRRAPALSSPTTNCPEASASSTSR